MLKETFLLGAGAPNPDGEGYLLLSYGIYATGDGRLSYDDEPDNTLTLNVVPDPEKRYAPLAIEGSDGERIHGLAVSLADRLVFVHFHGETPSMQIQLAAFKPSGRGFKKLYQVEAPKISLATDEFSQRVAAVYVVGNETRAVTLGENEPVFSREKDHLEYKWSLPSFQKNVSICGGLTGEMNERVLTLREKQREYTSAEFEMLMEEMKTADAEDPGEILAFIIALNSSIFFQHFEGMMDWFEETHPRHWKTKTNRARKALLEREWAKVVSLLEGVPLANLDDGSARHVCHLLGMALFAQGRVPEALKAWRKGAAFEEGDCKLDDLIAYAEISIPPRKKRKASGVGEGMVYVLELFEEVDDHFFAGRWSEAAALMEEYGVPAAKELQSLARFSEALLRRSIPRGDSWWFRKVFVLATYCECSNEAMHENQVLPPHIETWSRERLEDVAVRATRWLKKEM